MLESIHRLIDCRIACFLRGPMIPQRLTLRNFLSYREATLNFQGLHTACICGANGAGKSSLLEAIAWALWGQSRAATEDDVIHMGEAEAIVDFVFVSHQQIYRIIRSRTRGQATLLELQVAVGANDGRETFRSITGKGVRATQQLILEHIKLDYDTFVNSAYLRQGRADEFMVKRPSDRKQVLADLLKLSQYDVLAERAKDQARRIKGQIDALEQQLMGVAAQLERRSHTVQEQGELEATIAAMQSKMERDRHQVQALQAQQQQRQLWQQQLTWHQTQQQNLQHDCQRLHQDVTTTQQELADLETLLNQAEAIAMGYAQWQALHREEENFATRATAAQALQAQRHQYHQRQTEQLTELQTQWQQLQTELAGLQQQDAEIQTILQKSEDVAAGLQELRTAREALSHFDQVQTQVAPLLQRQQQIHTLLERSTARLVARRDELRATVQTLQLQQARHPQLAEAVQAIGDRVEILEKQRTYQQRVREKGLERRSFMERLQAHQRDYETQLGELEQKLQLLRQGVMGGDLALGEGVLGEGVLGEGVLGEGVLGDSALGDSALGDEGEFQRGADPDEMVMPLEWRFSEEETEEVWDGEGYQAPAIALEPSPASPHLHPPHLNPPHLNPPNSEDYPPCPLCDRPLDEQHWHLVLEKHRIEQQAILEQLWVVREQLAVSEREIQILRQEYWELEQELAQYGSVLERRGQLQEQLNMITGGQTALQQALAEIAKLEQILQTQAFEPELREELRIVEQSLQRFDYDDRNHALARGLVDRWRWADIKQAEIRQAQRRQAALAQRMPVLQAQLAAVEAQRQQRQAETDAHLHHFDRQLAELGYDPKQHQSLRQRLRQAQDWPLRHQALSQAQQKYPAVRQQLQQLHHTLQERYHQFQQADAQWVDLQQRLSATPDPQAELMELEQSLGQQRSRLDSHLANLGRVQQQQQQLDALSSQHVALDIQLASAQHQQRIYQELATAFGKNGIQTLMIENVLPQLEAETNHILSRLSNHQLHIQFITQRTTARPQKSKAAVSKPIETLDILIADANGTRPYETYSGGEAFRVNFAIRLALSKLLAQRSGTALQLLIIDEGFGTQDAEGCDRLIAAINAIAVDFACILTVTHVPHFKEAFQSRIEVFKTEAGSKFSLSI